MNPLDSVNFKFISAFQRPIISNGIPNLLRVTEFKKAAHVFIYCRKRLHASSEHFSGIPIMHKSKQYFPWHKMTE